MTSIRSATLSHTLVNILAGLIRGYESYTSPMIHAKGLLILMVMDGRTSFDHSTLQVVTEALKEIAARPGTLASEKLQNLLAKKFLHVLEFHTVEKPAPTNKLTTGKFVCLEGIEHRNRFITSCANRSEDEIVRLSTGEVVYTILGYANSIEEGQRLIGIAA